MRTVYQHTNSNGHTRDIDAAESESLLRMYPLAYYSMANDCNGGKGFGTCQDILWGREVSTVSCKLDDDTMKGSWLSAISGSKATARKILDEWNAIIARPMAIAAE